MVKVFFVDMELHRSPDSVRDDETVHGLSPEERLPAGSVVSEFDLSPGQFLAMVRKQRGWSQEELVFRSGISRAQISRIERGTSFPGLETIRRLESVLEVDLLSTFLKQKGFCRRKTPVPAAAKGPGLS